MKGLFELINTMSSKNALINPTEIYNEGWMTRLVMYYSVEEGLAYRDIGIEVNGTFNNKNWTSEALISSPFVSAKTKREGYTHPDIAIGDFSVDFSKSGRLIVDDNAKEFGIIEAKLNSPLSKETKNAKDFNQASRSVACISANTNENCTTFFYVVLPKSKSNHQKRDGTTIKDIVDSVYILQQIKSRVKAHNNANKSDLVDNRLLDKVKHCSTGVINYEDWINAFKNSEIRKELNEFYDYCKIFNKIL